MPELRVTPHGESFGCPRLHAIDEPTTIHRLELLAYSARLCMPRSSFICLVLMVLLSAALLAQRAAADEPTAKEPDQSTPESTSAAFTEAQLKGDGPTMKAIAIYNKEWGRVIDAEVALAAAKTRLHKAAVAKWGDVLTNMNFGLFKPEPKPDNYVYTITGDTAAYAPKDRPHFIIQRFKRIDGKWKLDLSASEEGLSMMAMKLVRKVTLVSDDFATKVVNGEFKTAKEAADAYTRTLVKR